MTEVKRDLSADLVAETVKRDLHHDLTICNAATPGPWRYDAPDDDCDDHYVLDALDRYIAQTTYDILSSSMRHNYVEDARFIAEARAGWPEAIQRAIDAEEALQRIYNVSKRTDFVSRLLDECIGIARDHLGIVEPPDEPVDEQEAGEIAQKWREANERICQMMRDHIPSPRRRRDGTLEKSQEQLEAEVAELKSENERLRMFMSLRTLAGEYTELEIYELTEGGNDGAAHR